MSQRLLVAVAVLLASLVAGLAVFWQPAQPLQALPQAVRAAPDFSLDSADGPVRLQDFRGKLLLVYFGYTFCPDVCPTSLAATAEGLRQLTPAEQAKVAMLFISVDPERDTPAHLKEYASFFHPAMVGATASSAVIADVARRYGVFYARQPAGPSGAYAIDHTADTILIGADGELLGTYPHALPPDQVAARLRQLLAKEKQP